MNSTITPEHGKDVADETMTIPELAMHPHSKIG